MGKKSEKGNVIELVVIGVLVLAIVGLLVWRFTGVKDQAAVNQDQVQTGENQAQSTKLIVGAVDSRIGTPLTFNFPETWKKQQDYKQDPTYTYQKNDSISLTSPSGKYIVKYSVVTGGGLGGVCVPEEQVAIQSFDYEDLASFSGIAYMEYTTTSQTQEVDRSMSTTGAAGLYKADSVHKIKTSSSICDIYLADYLLLGNVSDNEVLLFAYIEVQGVKTSDEFKAALTGSEYEQAKAILLSTKNHE